MAVSLTPRALGSSSLAVSPLCLGTSGWGGLRHGETDADRLARTTALAERVLASAAYLDATGLNATGLNAADPHHSELNAPELNAIDTSNIYGSGESERALGVVIQRLGGLPTDRVLMTKLDRNATTGACTGEQMWRSLEESLERLHLASVQVLFLHDPEHIGFEAAMEPRGPVDALIEMKQQGLAQSIGISGGPVGMLQRFVDSGIFDHLISHNRFTLIDRSASSLYESAKADGMGVVNAAPYGGGALSGRPGADARYGYRPAPPEVRSAVAAMAQACAGAGVPLSAAALQFSMRSALVDSTIVGASSIDRLDASIADARADIPDSLWRELDALAPAGFALDR